MDQALVTLIALPRTQRCYEQASIAPLIKFKLLCHVSLETTVEMHRTWSFLTCEGVPIAVETTNILATNRVEVKHTIYLRSS